MYSSPHRIQLESNHKDQTHSEIRLLYQLVCTNSFYEASKLTPEQQAPFTHGISALHVPTGKSRVSAGRSVPRRAKAELRLKNVELPATTSAEK